MQPGRYNALTDVPGVLVGHYTLTTGESRTGVTAIRPLNANHYTHKVTAAAHVLNGFGKTIGIPQIEELGELETPILLTSTLAVPKAADALISWMLTRCDSSITSLNPVVGECNDSYLCNIAARPLQEEHVFAALDSASTGAVAEGAVGGGAGMTAFGFKGGIGTASRVLTPEQGGYTVAMLVMANFGASRDLLIAGVPVGQIIANRRLQEAPATTRLDDNANGDGSIMMILATDAPLNSRQLLRLAKRAPMGLARTGSVASHGSGDFVLAFSTGSYIPRQRSPYAGTQRLVPTLYEDAITPLFSGVVESTEEAIYNALFMAETTTGYQGHTREALPVEEVLSILKDHNRLY